MHRAHELVREHLRATFEDNARHYNRLSTEQKFSPGDAILYRNPAHKPGLKKKLCATWDGPSIVMEMLGDVTYRIQRSPHSHSKVINTNRLKLYTGNAKPTWFDKREATRRQKGTEKDPEPPR